MRVYKVSRTDRVGYDQHHSFVCVAANRIAARAMHPRGDNDPTRWQDEADGFGTWVSLDRVHTLDVECIGTLAPIENFLGLGEVQAKPRVILASFRVG